MKVLSVLAIVVCSVLLQNDEVESSRILCVYPSPSRSHVLVGQALLKGLAERNHQVTMVSPFKLAKPVPNYRDVVIPVDDYASKLAKSFLEKPGNFLKTVPEMVLQMMKTANSTINDPQFLALKEEKFDLVIVGLFVADYVLGLGPHFGAPTAVLFSAGLTKMTADLVGNPLAVAAVPNMMQGRVQQMGFIHRLKNFAMSSFEALVTVYSVYHQKGFYQQNFPSDRYPSYDDVRNNVSLLLLNTHFSAATPRPYLQNVVEVGGLQIKTKPDPLPEDIQRWLDGAEHGAIYFCLGSNLKSTDLPAEKLQVLIKSLASLKQRVLWKWESDSIPNQPVNVMTKKWLPQDDVLAHKNVVLFISHGGLGGMAEARYHGVPVLGIPIFAEQSGNVGAAASEGWALMVDYATLCEQSFTGAIHTMVGEPRFREVALSLAKVYRDRPQSAMELACYWVEYVIRHKGAPQLHYQGADLNFWQINLIDVAAVILGLIYVVFKVFVRMLKRAKRALRNNMKYKMY